jgi:hypothetical protein
MRLCPFIFILPLLWLGSDVKAQVPEEFSSMPEQWQLTLDVIKSKAQNLLVENNGLEVEYRQLIGQAQRLQRSIEGQQDKNGQLESLLNERHGRTDQQVRIEELTRDIQIKDQKAREYDQQFEELKRKLPRSRPKAQEEAPMNDQLGQLRKELEEETTQEVLLENALEALKAGGSKAQDMTVGSIEAENQELESRLDYLRLQKLRHVNRSLFTPASRPDQREDGRFKERKRKLESQVYDYEERMEDLRRSYLMALSGPVEKKKLVHVMVELDARNDRIKDQIKVLHEDIDVLKDQVARLERRVNFAQGKDEQQ